MKRGILHCLTVALDGPKSLAHGVARGARLQVLGVSPRRAWARAWPFSKPLTLGIFKMQVQEYGLKFNLVPHDGLDRRAGTGSPLPAPSRGQGFPTMLLGAAPRIRKTPEGCGLAKRSSNCRHRLQSGGRPPRGEQRSSLGATPKPPLPLVSIT